jgi:hypothetical protein
MARTMSRTAAAVIARWGLKEAVGPRGEVILLMVDGRGCGNVFTIAYLVLKE